MLVTVENVLTNDELATVRALITRSPWEPGTRNAGSQAATVKNNEQLGASGGTCRSFAGSCSTHSIATRSSSPRPCR